MPPPDQLQPGEALGRAIFDGKHLKSALRGNTPPKVFLERAGVRDLSVDRLNFADLKKAAAVQGDLRGRPCRGWAQLPLEDAATNGRQVHSDPIPPDQECHAYIQLPFPDLPELDQAFVIQNAHALELAMKASLVEIPDTPVADQS